MTVGNGAGTVAVGILVLVGQASDGTPSILRPATVLLAPAPTNTPEVGRTAEIASAARTEPPKISPSIPLVAPPPAPESAAPVGESIPPPRELAQRESGSEPASAAEQASRSQAEKPPAAEPTPPQPATAAKVETLDLASLEKRLRDTKAIGVFTKLSLKNQVDDLLEQFRDFHKSRDQSRLAQLRQAFELLVLKVLSLLQDGDPALARDVSSSREALWEILADPEKFKDL